MKKPPTIDAGEAGRFPAPSTRVVPAKRPTIDVSKLGKALLESLVTLPDQQGVYLAVDGASRVWYVGKAKSVRDRLANHDQLSNFKSHGVTAIAVELHGDADGCDRREKELIEYYHPPLNDHHNFHHLPECDLGLTPDQEIERFFRLRIQLKLVELELEVLKPNIVSRCEQAGGKLSHVLGSIRRQEFRSWKYSEEIDLLTIRLKNKKKLEEENGTAKAQIKVSPVAKVDAEVLSREVEILLSRMTDADKEAADGPTAEARAV